MTRSERPGDLRRDIVNLPNLLTLARVALVPVVLVLLDQGSRQSNLWAAVVYVLCTVTDALDGWLARRRGLVSVLGKFLDPLADKLLVTSVLVWLVHMERIDGIAVVAVIVILARELSMTALRTIAMSEGVVIAAGEGGKAKTALQMVAILLLILHHDYELDWIVARLRTDLHEAGLALLWLSVVLALTSAGEYVRLFAQAVAAKERRLARERSGASEPPPSEPAGPRAP
ncbi:MAG: CDP-diacylglycerol--glycerol-3-phosphate 3-phosphatidyltransferase [Myxococcota bacterium]|nr:CDP-diacylglycerol--glycerol-3-phosphate 3-phosphatidyltransferase [Myxococcota bacterium]MDW8363533.1 CDP-diacylglycerol--glycerol-3-phosphate 3-phosphatidyltransferase [Myxococcales bacterium]